jgi:hypothetical protein
MTTFDEKLQAKKEGYAKTFRIEDLNDANDKSTLDIMLKTEVMIDDLQYQIQELIDDDPIGNAGNVKKLHDLLRDASTMILAYQKTLAIDRKTRKTEETASVADYIRALKRDAREFMDQRIVKVYCPDCKIMVGRIYPVHDHTAYSCSFQCSQCNKLIRARREDKDVLFDVRDAAWRRKYKPEVIQPKQFTRIEHGDNEDDLVIDGSQELITDNLEFTPHTTEDEVILGDDDGTIT